MGRNCGKRRRKEEERATRASRGLAGIKMGKKKASEEAAKS